MKMRLFISLILIVMALSFTILSACERQVTSPDERKTDSVSKQASQVIDVEPAGKPAGVTAESPQTGSQIVTPGDNIGQPVIDRLEVLLRSGMESNTIEIKPGDDAPQPEIEIKTLYTAEITCIARSLTGESLQYDWKATGGKIYGSGQKITWLAPHTPIIYRITATATDSGGSSSASVNISVRCCY